MEAIKSYFSKIIPQGSISRKGSGKIKRGQIRESGRPVGMPHRSASTSHVDLDSRNPDLDAVTMGSFSPSHEMFRFHQRASEPHCSPRKGPDLQESRRDVTRSPPPNKPPRKDLIFSVQLDTEGLNDIGVEIDCVPSSGSCSPNPVPTDNYFRYESTKEYDSDPKETCLSFGNTDLQSDWPAASGQGLTFKVVALTQGSRCNLDGRVKINDEIVDINGNALHKETRESVR